MTVYDLGDLHLIVDHTDARRVSTSVYITSAGQPAGVPPCCICDPATCAADQDGEHCEVRSCGTCLHGCPAPAGKPCCLDGDDQR